MSDQAYIDEPYTVLFICSGNSDRSIIAEALLNRMGEGRFKAFSAGCLPKGTINPHTLPIVAGLGFEASDFRSKPWEEFTGPNAPELDFVFTVCDDAAGEVSPAWPGDPHAAHWGVADPAAVHASESEIAAAFGHATRVLRHRIELFLALPIEKLDRMSLHHHLHQIGQHMGEPAPTT